MLGVHHRLHIQHQLLQHQPVALYVSTENQQSLYLPEHRRQQESSTVLSMLALVHRASNATSERTLLKQVGGAGC